MVRVHSTGRLSAAVSWLRPRVAQGWAWAGRPTQTAAPRSCYPSLRSLRQTASQLLYPPRSTRGHNPGSDFATNII